MELEIMTLKDRGVMELVPDPGNLKPIPCRWVFDIKKKSERGDNKTSSKISC